MTPTRRAPELGHIADEELERLAVTWRARALHGDREAFGVAHDLEVELRQRVRTSQMAQLPSEPAPVRPWWKFWGHSGDTDTDGRPTA